jgi:hypothetical protein
MTRPPGDRSPFSRRPGGGAGEARSPHGTFPARCGGGDPAGSRTNSSAGLALPAPPPGSRSDLHCCRWPSLAVNGVRRPCDVPQTAPGATNTRPALDPQPDSTRRGLNRNPTRPAPQWNASAYLAEVRARDPAAHHPGAGSQPSCCATARLCSTSSRPFTSRSRAGEREGPARRRTARRGPRERAVGRGTPAPR